MRHCGAAGGGDAKESLANILQFRAPAAWTPNLKSRLASPTLTQHLHFKLECRSPFVPLSDFPINMESVVDELPHAHPKYQNESIRISPVSTAQHATPPLRYAFLNHSAVTVNQNLPPCVDDKPLARQRRRRTRFVY